MLWSIDQSFELIRKNVFSQNCGQDKVGLIVIKKFALINFFVSDKNNVNSQSNSDSSFLNSDQFLSYLFFNMRNEFKNIFLRVQEVRTYMILLIIVIQLSMPIQQTNFNCQLQAQKLGKHQSFPHRYNEDQLKQILEYCSTKKEYLYKKIINVIRKELEGIEINKKLDKLEKSMKRFDNQETKNKENKNNFAQFQVQQIATNLPQVIDVSHMISAFEMKNNLKQDLDSLKGANKKETMSSDNININQQFPKNTPTWLRRLPRFFEKILPGRISRSSYSALYQD